MQKLFAIKYQIHFCSGHYKLWYWCYLRYLLVIISSWTNIDFLKGHPWKLEKPLKLFSWGLWKRWGIHAIQRIIWKICLLMYPFLFSLLINSQSATMQNNQITFRTHWHCADLFFGTERCQNHLLATPNLLVGPSQREIRYWWRHK